jgi:N-acetylmuramoyl-L-alanine amidase
MIATRGRGSGEARARALTLGLAALAAAGCGASASTPVVRTAPVVPALSASAERITQSAPVAPLRRTAPALPLSGRVVTVDPGHNGGNFSHPEEIARLVNDGNGEKECDTTGTESPDGYRETDFNWAVALDLQRLLVAAGARAVLTRRSNSAVGPCITERAAIGNRAHSDAAISIHADGGPPSGSGFAVLVPAPIPSGINRSIIAPSLRLGRALRGTLLGIGLHSSTYDGVNGIAPRTDLGGLNLSRVPKVFVEVGNMQNRQDEAPMETPQYQAHVARALLAGLERYLGAA